MKWDGRVSSIAKAVAGVTTSAAGGFTLTHNLGYVPTYLSVETNNSLYICRPDFTTLDSSSVTVYVRNLTTGAVVASTAIGSFRWLAHP